MDSDVTVRRARVGSGHVILVEARSSGGSEEDVGAGELLAFEGVEEAITTISQRVTSALKAANPDRASVQFGIDVAVGSGGLTGLLARGSGAATLKVTLSWGGGGD
jgi:hypothetical protein